MTAEIGPVPAGQSGSWQPANDVERALLAATTAADLPEVMRILAAVPLFLPGFNDDDVAGTAPRQRLLTRERDGVPYLLVFTSAATLHGTVTADGWRTTGLVDLARTTPTGWGLAINPVTPIGVLIAPQDVQTLVPTAASMADFVPANEVERLLRDALVAPDGEVLLDLLVTSRVTVPIQPLDVDGVLTVPVFTSPERYDDFLNGRELDVPTATLDLVALLRRWPGAEYRLSVNPGSPIAFSMGGERAPGLLAYAVALVRRRLGDGPAAGDGGPARPVDDARLPATEPEPPVVLPPGGSVADLLRGAG
jgi:hypothetical protein